MAEDLLGGGLDIDGWNFLKTESNRNVAELTDRSYVHRQAVPLVLKCLLAKEQRQEAHEVIVAALETRSQIDPAWTGKDRHWEAMFTSKRFL